jgi:hypothetical protein
MTVKEDTAKKQAEAHRRIEPSILRIMRIVTSGEESPAEPVKLLEVNRDTSPSGIVPIAFGPTEGVPFPSVVVEVTPDEYEKLTRNQLELPAGWKLGETLYEVAGTMSTVR